MRCATPRERRHPDCTRWFWPGRSRSPPATTARTARRAPRAPPPPNVTVAHPRVEKLVEWTEFTGRFEAVQRVELRARVSGYLNSIDFRDGQVGREGRASVRDRPAAVRGRAASAPAPTSPAPRPRSSSPTSSSSGSPTCQQSPAFSRADLRPAACRRRRPRRPAWWPPRRPWRNAQLDLEYTRIMRAGRRAHLRSPGRHRQPGHRADAAHHDRRAQPDLLRLRHERGRLPRLSARGARGRAALDPRPLDAGQAQAGRRGRLGPRRAG